MSLRKTVFAFCYIASNLTVTAATAHANPYLTKLKEGWSTLEKGQIGRSTSIFTEAINLDPQHPAAHLSLAVAASLQQDWKTAITEFQIVLSAHPRDAVVWNGLGVAHLQQGQSADAMSCFEKALEIEPNYAAARVHLAFTLCVHNLPDRTLEECERVMKSNPDADVRGFAQQTRALAYLLKRHHDEALTAVKDALAEATAARNKPYPSWVALADTRNVFASIAHPLFVAQKLPEPRMITPVPPRLVAANDQPKPPDATNGNGQPTPTNGANGNGQPTPEPRQSWSGHPVAPPKPTPPQPPTIKVTFSPSDDSVPPLLRGVVSVTVEANSSTPIRYLRLVVGSRVRAVFSAPPYQWRWNTLVDDDGEFELRVRSYATSGALLGESKFPVRIQNKAIEPPQNDNEAAETSFWAEAEFQEQGNGTASPTSSEEFDFARQHARPLLALTAQPHAVHYLKAKIHEAQEDWAATYDALMEIYADDTSYLDVRAQVLILRERLYQVLVDDVLEIQFVSGAGNVVALTFDDGPRSPYTERILETLRQYNVKATFFAVGKMVDNNPDLMLAILKDGHEFANHSYLHYNMARMTPLDLEKEILRCEHAVRKVTGKEIRMFRPPGGQYDEEVRQAINGLGYKTVFWTANITSFPLLSPYQIAEKLVERVGQGGIILLHNGMDKSAWVLPHLLRFLRLRGTRIVTVSELLAMRRRK
jgi:peptidoglycan/xylan/chitin deacetylase (PgdA/CDA1 family)/Flp pilus assembly protein TadD